MKATLTGIIKNIFPSEIFGNFEKRIFWLEEKEGKYPNTWQLEMWQGDCNTLDKFRTGEEVTCAVDIKGKSWTKNGKESVFNSLKCWKIERVADPKQQQREANRTFYQPSNIPTSNQEPVDDLPF